MNGLAGISGKEASRDQAQAAGGLYRTLFRRLLSGLEFGELIVQEKDQQWTFGSGGEPCARLTVHDPAVYKKVVFGGSIGAGEAYMDKLWEVDDLTALVRIMVLNMELLDRMERGLALLLRPVEFFRHLLNANNRAGSRQNILAHYDLGNDMYETFLDPTMMYSSAIYPAPESTLEEAQQNKLEILCRKLDLRSDDSVIEIGTGWGGFAIYAARNYGCHVTTTTISDAQFKEAEKRVAAAGLADRITVLQRDYRDLTGKYDKLVSIEMIEAVGNGFLPGFFRKCADLLTPEGKMVLQAITITDQKYKQYVRGVDFIQRYIFPGGCVPSISRMVHLIAEKTDMVVRQIDDFGFDYARTIEDWLERFQHSYPMLQDRGYDERFKRMWEFYLCYCLGGFLERSISVVHLVATRPANRGHLLR